MSFDTSLESPLETIKYAFAQMRETPSEMTLRPPAYFFFSAFHNWRESTRPQNGQ